MNLCKAPVSLVALWISACGTDVTAPVPDVVDRVEVTAPAGSLQVGGTLQLSATVRRVDGVPITGRPVEWLSMTTAVATVTAGGLVTAHAPGPVTIRATSDTRSGQVELFVEPPPIARVAIQPSGDFTLDPGKSRQLLARTYLENDVESFAHDVAWGTSDEGIATVSPQGLVVARGGGFAWITATVAGRSDQVRVDVPGWFEADLSRVDGVLLPVLWQTVPFTDPNGVALTRTIRITGGRIRLDLTTQRYEQVTTMERWEEVYVVLNGVPVVLGVQLKEVRDFTDQGSAGPLHSGVDLLVFVSDVLAGHIFNGYRVGTRVEVTQQVNAFGDLLDLRFGG